jgi:hypothetical protein
MATIQDVISQLERTVEAANQALETEASTAYNAAMTEVNRLEAQARETLQGKLSDHLWPIVEKLESDTPLAAADQDLLKTLLVGDATYYVKYENDVEKWQEEIKRLGEEMRRLQAGGVDELGSLMHLQALCHEALRVLPDLAFYYEEKERLRRFEQAMQGAIDRDTRRTLANLIKEILTSDQV